jgi:fibronectin type 3 domain-containing protein
VHDGRHGGRPLRAAVLAGAIALTGAAMSGERGPSTRTLIDRRPAPPEKTKAPPPSHAYGLDVARAPLITLGPVDVEALLAEDAARARNGEKLLRIGVPRDILITGADGAVYDIPDIGRLWVVEIESQGAEGIRLHFRDVDLPRGVRLDVFLAGSSEPDETYYGRPARGRGTFWTPIVFGDRLRVECFIPLKGDDPNWQPDFRIDGLQHIYRVEPPPNWFREDDCHNDVTCYPDWKDVANATALITFVTDFGESFCTGQLLNTEIEDQSPYFLTANHCIGAESEAESVTAYWFYQTSECNGNPPSLNSLPRSPGARLLVEREASDATLLEITGALPIGVAWAGWTPDPVRNGTPSVGVHHPDGSYKRISFGDKIGDATSDFVEVNWSSGVTEPGSSGSGIYEEATQQLFGQLYGGYSFCDVDDSDFYGAFAASYPDMAPYLGGGADDEFDDNDACASGKTVSDGNYDDLVVKSGDDDWYTMTIGAGGTMTATITYQPSEGDVELELRGACDGPTIATPQENGAQESVTYSNTSTASMKVVLRVFLSSNVRNVYQLSLNTCYSSEPPTGLTATDSASCDAVRLTWDAVPGAAQYEVWRSEQNDSARATRLKNVTDAKYEDRAVVAGTTYYYWIKAIGGCGTSIFSVEDSGSLIAPLAATAGVSASDGAACDRVAITWAPVAGATGYEVLRGTSNEILGATRLAEVSANSFDDLDVAANELFHYWIIPINDCGPGPASEPEVGHRLGPPAAPRNVSATDTVPCDRIRITWAALADATEFRIYRSTVDNWTTAAEIGASTTNSYEDASGELGVTYFYWVRALNVCGASGVTWSDAGVRAGPPPAPTQVSVTDGTLLGRVQVSWNRVPRAVSYLVWRSADSDPANAELLGQAIRSPFDDETAEDGVQYYYWLQAQSECSNSEVSAPHTGSKLKLSSASDADTARATPGSDGGTTGGGSTPLFQCGFGALGAVPLTVGSLLALRRTRWGYRPSS